MAKFTGTVKDLAAKVTLNGKAVSPVAFSILGQFGAGISKGETVKHASGKGKPATVLTVESAPGWSWESVEVSE